MAISNNRSLKIGKKGTGSQAVPFPPLFSLFFSSRLIHDSGWLVGDPANFLLEARLWITSVLPTIRDHPLLL